MPDKGLAPRSCLTANGRVSLSRRRWRGPAGGVVPVDRLLDAAEATVSLGTRELCCRASADSRSFARAAAGLKQLGQLPLSTELLRQVVEEEGKAVLRASESGELKPGWAAADCPVQTPAGEATRLYLGTDGFMVRVLSDQEKQARRRQVVSARRRRGRAKPVNNPGKPPLPPLPPRRKGADGPYKEFKLVQFHDESMEHRLVSVTRRRCHEAGRIMRRDAGRIGFHEAKERLGNVDGGPWIVKQIQRRGINLTGLCLDFYHLGQNVNQAKGITYGQDNPQGSQWAAGVLHAAKHDGYDALFDQLLEWRKGQRGRAKRQEADRLLHYVCERKEMIHYDTFMAHGWRISSSTTESQCGVVPARVKGGGKRWDGDNAEAVMALEAAIQSNLWTTYWVSCAPRAN